MDAQMGVSTKSKSKFLLYGLLFLYFAGLIIFLSYNLLDGLIQIQQEEIFIGMILFMILGLAIVQTIFSSINILYFTKDSEYLLPLPLKPYQIILARTNYIFSRMHSTYNVWNTNRSRNCLLYNNVISCYFSTNITSATYKYNRNGNYEFCKAYKK